LPLGVCLIKLLRFFVLNTRRYPFLKHLIHEIPATSIDSDDSKEFVAEVAIARMLLSLRGLAKSIEKSPYLLFIKLDSLLKTAWGVSKSANANLRIALGSALCVKIINDALRVTLKS
jgi:hypothetical protein